MSDFPQLTAPEILALDPLDIQVSPGIMVRDMRTPEECTSAILRLEMEMCRIQSQIAKAEENPASVQSGWRTRAQGAMRWKKRAIKALNAHSAALAKRAGSERGTMILKVIREEVGEAAFEDYVNTARRRYPEAFGEPVDSGEN